MRCTVCLSHFCIESESALFDAPLRSCSESFKGVFCWVLPFDSTGFWFSFSLLSRLFSCTSGIGLSQLQGPATFLQRGLFWLLESQLLPLLMQLHHSLPWYRKVSRVKSRCILGVSFSSHIAPSILLELPCCFSGRQQSRPCCCQHH
jgi:hypothetical protein